MIWTIIAIAIGVILIFITSPTSALVGWFLDKFALQPKLEAKDSTVTYNGTQLDEEDKIRFITYFNEARFVDRNHIFPGTETSFLQPETNDIPFVIHVTSGKKEIRYFLYCNDEHIDVVKQWKKKVASYTVASEHLQSFNASS